MDSQQSDQRLTYYGIRSLLMGSNTETNRPSSPEVDAELKNAAGRAVTLARTRSAANEAHVFAVEYEIEKLQTKLEQLNSRQITVDQEQDAAESKYALIHCHQLCQVLLKKLPRELQDIVYGFLLEEFQSVQMLAGSWRIRLRSYTKSRRDYRSGPHYLREKYTGAVFQQEILEFLYARTHFDIMHVDETQKTLYYGLLTHTLLPRPLDFVRSLSVQVSFQEYHQLNSTTLINRHLSGQLRVRKEGHRYFETIATKHDFEQKALQLAGIAKMKHLKQLKLHISVRTYVARAASMFEEALRPFVHELQDRGAKVDAECGPYTFLKNVPSLPAFSSFECDFDRPKSK